MRRKSLRHHQIHGVSCSPAWLGSPCMQPMCIPSWSGGYKHKIKITRFQITRLSVHEHTHTYTYRCTVHKQFVPANVATWSMSTRFSRCPTCESAHFRAVACWRQVCACLKCTALFKICTPLNLQIILFLHFFEQRTLNQMKISILVLFM